VTSPSLSFPESSKVLKFPLLCPLMRKTGGPKLKICSSHKQTARACACRCAHPHVEGKVGLVRAGAEGISKRLWLLPLRGHESLWMLGEEEPRGLHSVAGGMCGGGRGMSPLECSCAHRCHVREEDDSTLRSDRKRKACEPVPRAEQPGGELGAEGKLASAREVRTPPATVVRTLCAEGAERRIALGRLNSTALSPSTSPTSVDGTSATISPMGCSIEGASAAVSVHEESATLVSAICS